MDRNITLHFCWRAPIHKLWYVCTVRKTRKPIYAELIGERSYVRKPVVEIEVALVQEVDGVFKPFMINQSALKPV